MIERLGNVLYWLGCTIAGLLAIGGIFAGLHESAGHGWMTFAFFEVAALLAWLAGRAFRYILSGK